MGVFLLQQLELHLEIHNNYGKWGGTADFY